MKFVDWFPYYQGIRAEFGYSTEKDQEAARTLSGMIKRKALDTKVLEKKIKGKNVIVIGAGSSLEDGGALKYLRKNKSSVKIAADGAAQFLIENKIKPDIVVTDLDVAVEIVAVSARVFVERHGWIRAAGAFAFLFLLSRLRLFFECLRSLQQIRAPVA